MKIVFDPSTLHQSTTGSITAVIYFEFGQVRQFPDKRWNDFVVVIVGWWFETLKQISEGKNGSQIPLHGWSVLDQCSTTGKLLASALY